MLCQNCGENEANVKYTQIINGVKKQMTLCDKCAKELGLDDINFSMPINFSNFLDDMFEMNEFMPNLLEDANTITCSKCGMTYEDFLKEGKFGCDECYDTFSNRIDGLLKSIQGTNRHIGRNAKYIESKENEKENNKQENEVNLKNSKSQEGEDKLEQLKERLKQEIKEERYEDAAKTRDEIKKLEGK